MTLLLTSDLNGNPEWYEWLIRNAHRVDAICVAGDLVDPYLKDLASQRELAEFTAWRLGGRGIHFFACEGDQDLCGPKWFWLKSLAGTRRIQDLAVTSVPWKHEDRAWFENPQRWRKATETRWLVLEHEPPRGTAVAAGATSELLRESPAMEFEPDFLLTGHMRRAPWVTGGSWWDRRGRTIVLNPGFDPAGSFPCHILLEVERREAVWRHPGGYESIRLDAFSSPFSSYRHSLDHEHYELHSSNPV